jgi:hypothetical protein
MKYTFYHCKEVPFEFYSCPFQSVRNKGREIAEIWAQDHREHSFENLSAIDVTADLEWCEKGQ